MKSRKAFTVPELLVAITIVTVLGTIAFFAFAGYVSNSRDSVRISDIANLKKVLSIFQVEYGFYPHPTNAVNITYSWATVFSQWTFWESTFQNQSIINKIPHDPLTLQEYPYSITANKHEFQIYSALEDPNRSAQVSFLWVTQSHAASSKQWYSIIEWNYNQVLTSVSTGWTDYILAIPSIIARDTDTIDIVSLVWENKLLFPTFTNVHSNYAGSFDDTNADFVYTPANLVMWEWDLKYLQFGEWFSQLVENLSSVYSGEDFWNFSEYSHLNESTLRGLNSFSNDDFTLYSTCAKLAWSLQESNDSVYTLKDSQWNLYAAYCDMSAKWWNPYPNASLVLDFKTGKAWKNGQSVNVASFFGVTRSSIGSYESNNWSISYFAANTLRYWDKGLLVEESRTNLVPDSTVFSSGSPWWVLNNVNLSQNVEIAPDGNLTADKLTFTTGWATRRMTVSNPSWVISWQTYTFSLWVKWTSWDNVKLAIHSSEWGTIYPSQSLDGSWQRLSLTAAVSWVDIRFWIWNDNGETTMNPIYIWWAQIEQWDFMTSYIPTSWGIVTRGGELIFINSSNWIGSTEGTIFIDWEQYGWINSKGVFSLHNSSGITSNRIDLRSNSSVTPTISYNGFNYSVSSLWSLESSQKVAIWYKAHDFWFVKDWWTVEVLSSWEIPVWLNRLQLWSVDGGVSHNIDGYIKKFVYWTERKSDTALQLLSE